MREKRSRSHSLDKDSTHSNSVGDEEADTNLRNNNNNNNNSHSSSRKQQKTESATTTTTTTTTTAAGANKKPNSSTSAAAPAWAEDLTELRRRLESLETPPAHNHTTTTNHHSPSAVAGEQEREVLHAFVTALLTQWPRSSALLTERLIKHVLLRVRPILLSQPMLVPVEAPVNVCGDIHGQITDLIEIFKAGGIPPHTATPGASYLFLGDYVDRGKYGSEVFMILATLKVLFPTKVYILRGNHETDTICRVYGFFDEVKRRFSVKLFKTFTDVFNTLPVSALVEEIALCMHGGLSPELRQLRQIEAIPRPLVVQDSGLACDLLWSDPEESARGWQPSERGVSFTFGEDVVERMCQQLNIDIVLRAHQVIDNGYSFFAKRKLVTIFSASNYCGEFTNSGAMMVMDEKCKCSFQIFKPQYE